MTHFYAQELENVYANLNTTKKGLTAEEAQKRLAQYGLNEIKEAEQVSPLKIFLSQFNSLIVWILITAMAISAMLGEVTDAIVIGVILVANAVIGFVQEYKAERAIEALRKMAAPKATVLRDGVEKEIDARHLVPGDVILLVSGDKIPADVRLIEAIDLKTQEASLTGESTPINKSAGAHCAETTPIADCKNALFAGTMVVNGKARAVVCATAMQTEIGKIAHLIQTVKPEPTPLQKKMKELGTWISVLTLTICVVIFLAGVMQGKPLLEFFIIAVALAVAAIPEGLPAVVTISLALGVRRMVNRHALVRTLPSVETLGCTTVICTDKTGTLTHNEMTVKKIYVDGKDIDAGGAGYKPEGTFSQKTQNLQLLLKIGALNNDAKLNEQEWKIIGDPTEGALLVSALKGQLDYKLLNLRAKRIEEIPFTSERKMMTTVHDIDGKKYVYVKGAPDVVLEKCAYLQTDNKKIKLDRGEKHTILEKNREYASKALRVLGFAYKEIKKIDGKEGKEALEKDLIFVGLQAMIDPPRDEVREAIRKCVTAGIKIIMVTGDHKETAVAIARDLGLDGRAISGAEIDTIDLERDVENIHVYARVDPRHKLKIVEALKKKGHVVAMTGDGVNDAPALKKADIGIAMGISGTDVSKEASDMILTDDNFASIVNAVEEGRGTYDNIRKYFAYLISGNISEVLIIFLSIIFGLPLPLTATQILFINLVTDGLPAVALSADPFEPNAMYRQPRKKGERIHKGLNAFIVMYPMVVTILTLAVFSWFYFKKGDLAQAKTATFLTISLCELYQAFSCRSTMYPAWKVGIFKNKYLVLAVASSVALLLAAVFIPSFGVLLNMVPLSLAEVLIIGALSSSGALFIELSKALKNVPLYLNNYPDNHEAA